jgi:hypothetical protein
MRATTRRSKPGFAKLREASGAGGQVDARRRVLGRHARVPECPGLAPEVAQTGLHGRDGVLALERLAVSGNHGVEVELGEASESVRPLVDEGVAHVADVAVEQVAGAPWATAQ